MCHIPVSRWGQSFPECLRGPVRVPRDVSIQGRDVGGYDGVDEAAGEAGENSSWRCFEVEAWRFRVQPNSAGERKESFTGGGGIGLRSLKNKLRTFSLHTWAFNNFPFCLLLINRFPPTTSESSAY